MGQERISWDNLWDKLGPDLAKVFGYQDITAGQAVGQTRDKFS